MRERFTASVLGSVECFNMGLFLSCVLQIDKARPVHHGSHCTITLLAELVVESKLIAFCFSSTEKY